MELFGRAHSVYVRSVRLCLEEKGIAYDLVHVDPFAPEGLPGWYNALQPFGKVPALRDGSVELFESDAILRYLEARYPNPPLMPAGDPVSLGRITQIMRIMDNYAYFSMVWSVFVPFSRDGAGKQPVEEGLARSRRVLEVLDRLMPGESFLAGDSITLADTHFLPAFVLFSGVPPGSEMLAAFPRLDNWLLRMKERPSVLATAGPLG